MSWNRPSLPRKASRSIPSSEKPHFRATSPDAGFSRTCRIMSLWNPISPKATDVGIARAKLMKNAVAAKGTVVAGSFDKGTVTVIRHGTTFEAELCETAPFTDGEDVESTLAAHLYKGAVGAGKTAWLILNGESGVTSGDLIGAK